MAKTHEPIPPDFPVQPLKKGQKAEDEMTCGHCGLSWDDAIETDWTPVPSARCPFEYFHIYPDDEENDMAKITKKRKDELKEIARQLHYANLSPSATEDVISICATVSKGFDGHAGEELTIEEGSLVEDYLSEVEEDDNDD